MVVKIPHTKMPHAKNLRAAFSMIELVFAIVIIAISALSLPMMTQATSLGVYKNLETQEAIFKAVVLTKKAIGEYSFADIDNVAKSSYNAVESGGVGLTEYKFPHYYTLTTATVASFGALTESADVKKVTTNIYKLEGGSCTLMATFSAYKFNY